MRHYEIVFMVHPDQSEQVPLMIKKTNLYKERDEKKRKIFLERINKITSERIVYIDENGIDRWSKKGTVIYGEVSRKRYAESFYCKMW